MRSESDKVLLCSCVCSDTQDDMAQKDRVHTPAKRVLIVLPRDLVVAAKKAALDQEMPFRFWLGDAIRRHLGRTESEVKRQ